MSKGTKQIRVGRVQKKLDELEILANNLIVTADKIPEGFSDGMILRLKSDTILAVVNEIKECIAGE